MKIKESQLKEYINKRVLKKLQESTLSPSGEETNSHMLIPCLKNFKEDLSHNRMKDYLDIVKKYIRQYPQYKMDFILIAKSRAGDDPKIVKTLKALKESMSEGGEGSGIKGHTTTKREYQQYLHKLPDKELEKHLKVIQAQIPIAYNNKHEETIKKLQYQEEMITNERANRIRK